MVQDTRSLSGIEFCHTQNAWTTQEVGVKIKIQPDFKNGRRSRAFYDSIVEQAMRSPYGKT
jgi:hypothetical protein